MTYAETRNRFAALCAYAAAMEARAGDRFCEPQPEKELPSTSNPTQAGNLCRINKRIDYLQALIQCEQLGGNLEKCCDEAYKDYCTAWDACPE